MSRVLSVVAFPIFLLTLASCAPAQNPVASVKISFAQSSFANSGLISDSTTISNDFCYALYVTGEGISTPDSDDTENDCGGSGGRVVGLFGRQTNGDTEVEVANLPVGKNYRFDLLGIRKSYLAPDGFDCSSKLNIQFNPGQKGGQEPKFFMTPFGQAAPTPIPEPPFRYFARGDLIVTGSDNTVVLKRSNEKDDYDFLTPADTTNIGTAFSCQMKTKVFPWARKATAVDAVSVVAGDSSHGTIFTSSPRPMMRIACPVDVNHVKVSITLNDPSNVVASSVALTCGPGSPAVYTWPYDISATTNGSKVDRVISHVQFFNGATLKDLQSNRWVYNADENIQEIPNSLIGNPTMNAAAGTPTVAGILDGHMLLSTNGFVTKVPLVLQGKFPFPNLFGAPVASGSGGVLLDLISLVGPDDYGLSPLNNTLFDLTKGKARTVQLTDNPSTILGLGAIATSSGPTTFDRELLFQATISQKWIFKNSIMDGPNFINSTSVEVDETSINATSIFDGISAKLFKATNGDSSIVALTQDDRGNVALGFCKDAPDMLANVNQDGCAESITPIALSSESTNPEHGTSSVAVKHITETFNYRGNMRALRMLETMGTSFPASGFQLITHKATNPYYDVVYGTAATYPQWDGKIQFLKSIPYRSPGLKPSPLNDQNQLIAGGWTLCAASKHCAVVYRSLDSGLTWTRTYLGPQDTEMRGAHVFEIPATYSLDLDRDEYRHSLIFLRVSTLAAQPISVLIQPPNSNGF